MSHTITEICNGCMACTTVCPAGAISGAKGKQQTIDQELCINCSACGRICVKEAVVDPHGIKIARIKRSQWPKPVIDLANCFSCRNCAEICPAGCITTVKENRKHNPGNMYMDYPVITDEKACIGCGWCAETCNFGAITMMVPEPAAAPVKKSQAEAQVPAQG